MRPSLDIGIEEEYQTIDPVTRDLRSHIDAEIIAKGKILLNEAVKAEMHQSIVEVGTGICKSVKDAKQEIAYLRREIIGLARDNGLSVATAAPTHSQIGASRPSIPMSGIGSLWRTSVRSRAQI